MELDPHREHAHYTDAARARSAKKLLALAEAALREGDHQQARQHAYNAVICLEGVNGTQALLACAERMLHEAWRRAA